MLSNSNSAVLTLPLVHHFKHFRLKAAFQLNKVNVDHLDWKGGNLD